MYLSKEVVLMYANGERITKDYHFQDHIDCYVPVQIYSNKKHCDIGFVEKFCSHYVKMNGIYYHRTEYNFVSRPGY